LQRRAQSAIEASRRLSAERIVLERQYVDRLRELRFAILESEEGASK
jgi:hypothetical protein